jgi:hypothetical protein
MCGGCACGGGLAATLAGAGCGGLVAAPRAGFSVQHRVEEERNENI